MSVSVVSIVFSQDKKSVVALKRCDVPIWVFPGGGVELNESPEDAAIREVFEETGLVVKIERKIGEYTPQNKFTTLTYLYECSIIEGNLSTGDETYDINFYGLNALPKPFLHVHKYWLEDALKNKRHVIKAQISGTTYFHFVWFFVTHPLLMLRYVLSWTRLKINSKPLKKGSH